MKFYTVLYYACSSDLFISAWCLKGVTRGHEYEAPLSVYQYVKFLQSLLYTLHLSAEYTFVTVITYKS